MPRKNLSGCRLYGILDLDYVTLHAAPAMAETLVAGGVDVVQLRAKNCGTDVIEELAKRLQPMLSESGVPFIINDYPQVARAICADGVHVGQDDMTVEAARPAAGENCIVGKSTHSIDQALRAAAEGADYIGFGPLFATPTKPDYQPIGLAEIANVQTLVSIPVFCIGGIKLENLETIIAAGARRVVIVSGLLKAPNVAEYARAAKRLLDSAPEETRPCLS